MKFSKKVVIGLMLAALSQLATAADKVAVTVRVLTINGAEPNSRLTVSRIKKVAADALARSGYEAVDSINKATAGMNLVINVHSGIHNQPSLTVSSYTVSTSLWSAGKSEISDTKQVAMSTAASTGLYSGSAERVLSASTTNAEKAVVDYIASTFK
ncbi:hypothetical protein TSA66_24675 [Noviherbaspirillum autotrophicum]|uniref:Uncharacterized protein n=2 Tax=Noviherbaspirillum autotrophicum TaxID=709839 RepID=A0A0C1Y8N8_9BURK|nr:hypothetical protein TSA66_24675 [Noviherbaspirillum autotrophicum]